jgi:catechol 2,3-dioxygenase-like lactoylglutathione lyase family enzyme
MRLLRAATLTVRDVAASQALYAEWLNYRTVEQARLQPALAEAWGAPEAADAPYAIMQPESGADIFLRFVQAAPHPDYRPLRTYGWAAIEICVQDVLAVNARMERSPFKIIGPPRDLDGLPAIFPMQVQGPDDEIVYLTQIRGDLASYDLPRAQSLIDHLFILVLANSDMQGALHWAQSVLGLSFGRSMKIIYTMLANSFSTPPERLFELCTVVHERDVFLEFDQYPPQATPRPNHPGGLPPGIALASLLIPDFDARMPQWADWAIAAPIAHDSILYAGRRSVTLRGPDGVLFEVIAP